MGILNFLTTSASDLVGKIGTIIDDVVTTDEEKLKLNNALQKEMNHYKLAVRQAENDYEKELTERLKADMTSDSWLSKNIRPLLLLILTITTIVLAYSTIFILDVKDVEKVKIWIPLLTTLLTTGFIFYFGSRGFEKIKSMKYKNENQSYL